MSCIVLLLLLELLFVRKSVGMSGCREGGGENNRVVGFVLFVFLSLVFGSGGGRVLGLGVGKGNLGAAETG